MGSRAGANEDDRLEGTAAEAAGAAEKVEAADAAGASGGQETGRGSKRNIYLLLGGLVVAGIAAGWNWLRGLPKDQEGAED